MNMFNWFFASILLLLAVLLFIYHFKLAMEIKKSIQPQQNLDASEIKKQEKLFPKLKKKSKRILILALILAWFSLTKIITLVFGNHKKALTLEVFPKAIDFFGFKISPSVLWTWLLIAIVLILALLFRFMIVPRFKEKPTGIQNVVECIVEFVSKYCMNTSGLHSDALNSYMLSIAVIMIGSAIIEMFGIRAPTSDLIMAGALAMVTFFMINYYGIRKKGIMGRIKTMAEPTPIVFPFELISMVATPISLACRLFGNMLGGMIVIDLLYVALGNASIGIPAIAGLYFNIFHPVIQAYIFITLSLTFIKNAVQDY